MRAMRVLRALLLLSSLQLAAFTEIPAECVIDLRCRECVPDAMPLVESHRAAGGAVRLAPGAQLALACRGTRFVAYPTREALDARCEGGRLRLAHDHSLRHLLELGCQENLFEDVLHEVEHCGPPHQGRAYQTLSAGGAGTRHLATLCFDAERSLPLRARAGAGPALPLRAHRDGAAPRSLLGNFNQLFDARARADAARLYGDEARLNRRLRELLRPDDVTLAGHELAAADLLAPDYFDDQDLRVADFPSNRVLVWRAVARGNLHRLQQDVAARMRKARNASAALDVWAGTHGVMSPGRFPVPRYGGARVRAGRRALALVLVNDPLAAVSEIRAAVFCESACARAPWLRRLLRARSYEVPALGLVFCCDAHSLAAAVPELPRDLIRDVPVGTDGMLIDDDDAL
ncbi:hypothetical protein MSG28_005413 [Choristoneura fumiferana]|uniref:Uncharacterized protein n=1 Tax=Choristoneura fumiferana TaxID=7141 RepID=A0ACC0JRG9_CHOFU|nr:hypothetical protein MSG28_005413 [Choristoneura fumiferana]